MAETKQGASAKSGWSVMDKAWEEVQKKTFTKWCNSHLVKKFGGEAAIQSISEDFQTGVKLMELLNALYGTSMPKHNKAPKMRPHKLDNIELAFKMLDQAGVKTHFLKPVHLVDCDTTMLLGMIWAIILDYQIKGISVEDLTAKEGLLLWCQKKTHGYKDVKVDNFTTSWQDGLAFCALIHKHRPDLLDFDQLSKDSPRENLELAFDVAEKKLGIPRLLDVEDIVDVPRPDERSVVTYVSEYFHVFAAQNQFEVAGRRIAKVVGLERTNDQLKNDYLQKAQALVDWINQNTNELQDRNYDNTLEDIEQKWDEFRNYKKHTKPAKAADKIDVEATLASLQAKLRVNNRSPFQPPEHLTIKAIDDKWGNMGGEENNRSDWLRKELERQQRLEALASRFWRKAAALLQWGNDNTSLLNNTDYGNSLAAVQAKLKNHEGFESNYQNTQTRLDSTKQLGQDLISEGYGKADAVHAKIADLDQMWSNVRQAADQRRAGLEAELERQQRFDTLRLEFATKARSLASWIEDAEDTLSETVKSRSLTAIHELQNAFQTFVSTNDNYTAEYNNLVQLASNLADEGITDNMYSSFTIEQITERWNRLASEIESHREALSQEQVRLEENDRLCQEFANKSNAFVQWCDQQRESIQQGTAGSIQEQLDALRQKGEAISGNRSALEELISLNHQIDERNITENPHTEQTIEAIIPTYDKLSDLVSKQSAILEKELLSQSGSKVSEEQLAEFRETFKQFDKDNSGVLEKHEFKACLSALGQSVNDEQLDKLIAQIGVKSPGKISFEEFVDFMISRIEESDSPTTVKNAFKTIAGDKEFVTEEELRRVLDKDTVDYLVQTMPRLGNGFDYNAYAEKTYSH